MPSSSSEKRLVPSIHVTIHPTVEKEKKKESAAVNDETQETASDQEVVEKLIGAKITGGIEFNMPLTIFDVIEKKNPFCSQQFAHCRVWSFFFLCSFQGCQRIKSVSNWIEAGRWNRLNRGQVDEHDEPERRLQGTFACMQARQKLQIAYHAVN